MSDSDTPVDPIDPELTLERFRGLAASADCIRKTIAEAEASDFVSDDHIDIVRRNCDHIGIACMYPDVASAGVDLEPFWAAQRDGHMWLG